MKQLILFLSLVVLGSMASSEYKKKLDPRLRGFDRRLTERAGEEGTDIIVRMQTSESLAQIRQELETRFESTATESKHHLVHRHLMDHAERTQRNVRGLVADMHVHHDPTKTRHLWIVNELAIAKATPELIRRLAQHPDTHYILPDEIAATLAGISGEADVSPYTSMPWGVQRIEAPYAWMTGAEGKGTVVGIIDTGINADHITLGRNRVVQWFDEVNYQSEPYDDGYHGTHIAGTIGSMGGLGVAPQVKFIVCKAFDGENAKRSALIACGQRLACPDPETGCRNIPHVINNSWNFDRPDDYGYSEIIHHWRNAGIIPVFAAGNNFEAKTCQDLIPTPPGSLTTQVLTIGAINIDNRLSRFSRHGAIPFLPDHIKPDFVAPGGQVVSADDTCDIQIRTKSGTSMATPHAVGAIALIWGLALHFQKSLSYDELYNILKQSSETTILEPPEKSCVSAAELAKFPNRAYGHGLINIRKAIVLARTIFHEEE